MKKAPRAPSCVIKQLPKSKQQSAAKLAAEINPANAPPEASLSFALDAEVWQPAKLAVLTAKYWGAGGVKLGVKFLDSPSVSLRQKLLAHMNAWGQYSNVAFAESASGEVRITRDEPGYWSYLGTDILQIDGATMCLQGFTEATPEAEFYRVVRHETGHTLGFPHEHLRRELVNRLHVAKTIAYFRTRYGWSEHDTRWNVLTPLEERSIMASEVTDQDSIMAYDLPASITKDGQPIRGGDDFSPVDKAFVATLYPLPLPPPSAARRVVLEIDGTVTGVRLVEGG